MWDPIGTSSPQKHVLSESLTRGTFKKINDPLTQYHQYKEHSHSKYHNIGYSYDLASVIDYKPQAIK